MRKWHMGDDFAACVFVAVDPYRIPLVLDPSKPDPKWKFPGGVKAEDDPGEMPRAGAIRELIEETGISCPEGKLDELIMEDRITHWYFLYCVENPDAVDFSGLRNKGQEGEIVRIVNIIELLELEAAGEIFRPHAQMLKSNPNVVAVIQRLAEKAMNNQ